MSFVVSIRGAKTVAPGVWRATLNPAHVRLIGAGSQQLGNVSVLLLTGEPTFDGRSASLSIDPGAVQVLNVGATDDAIVILGSTDAKPTVASAAPTPQTQTASSGDAIYLQHLSPALRDLGASLLQSVRKHFHGALKYHPRSGKFVESPDNFWTVRIQPRDRSLRITVRGRPESLPKVSSIELKADMGSYTAFKVSTMNQIAEAVSIIREASIR